MWRLSTAYLTCDQLRPLRMQPIVPGCTSYISAITLLVRPAAIIFRISGISTSVNTAFLLLLCIIIPFAFACCTFSACVHHSRLVTELLCLSKSLWLTFGKFNGLSIKAFATSICTLTVVHLPPSHSCTCRYPWPLSFCFNNRPFSDIDHHVCCVQAYHYWLHFQMTRFGINH